MIPQYFSACNLFYFETTSGVFDSKVLSGVVHQWFCFSMNKNLHGSCFFLYLTDDITTPLVHLVIH